MRLVPLPALSECVENKGEKANAGFRTNLIDPDDLQVCRIP